MTCRLFKEGRDGRRTAREIEIIRLEVDVLKIASTGVGRGAGSVGSYGLQGLHD